jgi:hypothetical protein
MEDDNSLPTGQAPPSTAGPSSGLDLPSDPTTYNPDTPWIPVGELQSADELKLSRARAARHRYTLKKKAEKAETEARLEEGRREIEKLQLEQNSLQYYGRALHNLSSYAACMVQALPQAKTSAAEALAAGMHGLESAQEWTRHQYVMIPTAVELMTTSLWTPTEAQMRWALQRTPTSEYENGHEVFFNRIAELLREGQRNPSSQQRVEKRVETLMTLWLRFTMLLLEDNKEAMEQHLCAKQVREFKQREAAKAVSVAPTPAVSVGGGGLGVVGDPVAAIPVNGASIPVSPAAAAVASAFEEDDDDGDEEEDTVLLPDASASRRHIVTIRGAQTTDLGTNFPRLSLQQIEVLGKEWKKFKRSVQGARKDLNRAVGEATAAYIANINFVDGSFAPESSAAMAEVRIFAISVIKLMLLNS